MSGPASTSRVKPVGAAAVDAVDRGRDQDLRAEFLRLDVGVGGELLAGDAGGEAEIVLDPHACPGLPAEGDGVEHDDRQPLRRRIDRRREAGGAAADDGDVVRFAAPPVVEHAELLGEVRLARIAENPAVRADDERLVGVLDAVVDEEREPFAVRLRIDDGVRPGVAAEEGLEPHHVARALAADEDRPAGAALDQRGAAEEEGVRDLLAELRRLDHQSPHSVGRHEDGLDVADRMAVDQRRLAGELPDLGEELARPLLDDRCDIAEPVAPGDGDAPREDHEHARAGLAGLEQRRACGVPQDLPERPDPVDLLGRERRESRLVARPRRRRHRVGRAALRGLVLVAVDQGMVSSRRADAYPAGPPAPIAFRHARAARWAAWWTIALRRQDARARHPVPPAAGGRVPPQRHGTRPCRRRPKRGGRRKRGPSHCRWRPMRGWRC